MGAMQNEFSWSKSRDSLFRECLRAYYLNHYGSWGGWSDKASEEVRELYVMKSLSSRAAWKGIVVHDAAERAVKAVRAGGVWALSKALEETEDRLRQELAISRDGRYREGVWIDWGGERIKVKGLQEHYYGASIQEEQWESIIKEGLDCIRNLYDSATYRRLRELPPDHILSVEDLESFLVGNVKVWIKMDLLVKGHDDRIVIVDWKTGRYHRTEDISLQLGIYGLYGQHAWGVSSDQILGFDVNLREGVARKHPIDADILGRVTQHIKESAARMRERLTDVDANLAEQANFPQTENLRVCRWCRFKRACGRE